MVLEKIANCCKTTHEYCRFCATETDLYNTENLVLE